MAYNHGVRISEVATSLLPTAEVSAGIPFIVGTAPVNMTDPSSVNVPKLVYSYAEAVKEFGYVPPADDAASGLKKFGFSISEFIYSQFSLFGVGPAIIVNVLDPTKHKVTASITQVALDTKTGSATIPETAIIASTVVLSVITPWGRTTRSPLTMTASWWLRRLRTPKATSFARRART